MTLSGDLVIVVQISIMFIHGTKISHQWSRGRRPARFGSRPRRRGRHDAGTDQSRGGKRCPRSGVQEDRHCGRESVSSKYVSNSYRRRPSSVASVRSPQTYAVPSAPPLESRRPTFRLFTFEHVLFRWSSAAMTTLPDFDLVDGTTVHRFFTRSNDINFPSQFDFLIYIYSFFYFNQILFFHLFILTLEWTFHIYVAAIKK